MNVSLMSFSKKKNSTATPSSGGSTKSGTLRTGCSVIRPIIGFELSRTVFANWNYAYISDFYRYYYIQDWKWEGGLWWAYMEVDPMASFKVGIGASSCYVLRAASLYDETISDSMYPTYSHAYSIIDDIQTPLWDTSSFNGGTYIVGIIGQSTGGGAVNYYALSPNDMENLKNALLSNTSYIGVTEITNELLKSLVNPYQYVVSCIWFPYSNIPTSSTQTIKFGWWTANGVSGGVVGTKTMIKQSVLYAQAHPLATRAYEMAAPFSKYVAFISPFGEIPLDSQILANGMSTHDTQTYCGIDVYLYIDLITGNGYIQLKVGDNLIAYRQGKIGVPVQLGQMTQNVGGVISSALSGIGAVTAYAASENYGQAFVSGAGAVMSGIQNSFPMIATSGVDCGVSLFSMTPHIETIFNKPVHENIEENGKPLCDTKTISSLSGYIKTMNADVVLAGATDAEQEQVRMYMNGGFFYE